MKILYILLTGLLLNHNYTNKIHDASAALGVVTVNAVAYQENAVTGTWTMCKTVSGERSIMYNVCPTFTFMPGGTGTIVFAGKTCNFLYEVKGASIVFSFKSLQDKKDFITDETAFSLEFLDNGKKLNIISTKRDYKLVMGKNL